MIIQHRQYTLNGYWYLKVVTPPNANFNYFPIRCSKGPDTLRNLSCNAVRTSCSSRIKFYFWDVVLNKLHHVTHSKFLLHARCTKRCTVCPGVKRKCIETKMHTTAAIPQTASHLLRLVVAFQSYDVQEYGVNCSATLLNLPLQKRIVVQWL